MKKILLFIILFTFLSLGVQDFFADEVYNMSNSAPIGVNYLDLKYLNSNGYMYSFNTTIPILLEENITYSIIASGEFMGQYENYFDLVDVKLKLVNKNQVESYTINARFNDEANLYYTTFIAKDTMINIDYFPMDTNYSSDIMVIKGTIDDFIRFESYLGPRFGKGYEAVLFTSPANYLDVEAIADELKSNNSSIIDVLVIDDHYTLNKNKSGNFIVTYYLLFPSSIIVYFVEIRVVDVTPPIIIGPNVISVNKEQVVTNEFILSYFTLSDDVSSVSELVKEVVYNEYIGKQGIVGSYEVKITVTDKALNTTSKIIILRVGISIPYIFQGPQTIYVYQHESLNEIDILNQFSAAEGVVASKLTKQILQNNYEETKNAGTYQVLLNFTYQETTNTSITVNHNLTIIVINQEVPIVNVPELFLSFDIVNKWSVPQIKEYILNNILPNFPNATGLELTYNEYENATKAGHYYIHFKFDHHGETYSSKLLVKIQDKKDYRFLFIVIPLGVIALGVLGYKIMKRKKVLIQA